MARKMVECPNCKGRGMIGYSMPDILTGKGAVFLDFECPFCKGRCWVSEKRAEKYKQESEKDEH